MAQQSPELTLDQLKALYGRLDGFQAHGQEVVGIEMYRATNGQWTVNLAVNGKPNLTPPPHLKRVFLISPHANIINLI